MARIPYPDPASLPPADRDFLADLPPLNVWRMLAGSPSMFRPMTAFFSAYLNDGLLTEEMREIVILRTGYLRDSEYEVANHLRDLVTAARHRTTVVIGYGAVSSGKPSQPGGLALAKMWL